MDYYQDYDILTKYFMPQKNTPSREKLMEIVQDCERTCYNMFHYILGLEELNGRRKEMRILADCGEICTSTSILLAHKSVMMRDQLEFCMKMCIMCANVCSEYDDYVSQNCARVCYNCALACKDYLQNM